MRNFYLSSHPLCEWPGCVAVAHQVDHVRNLAEHPDVDPYDAANLQSLCDHHHRVKTGHEGRRAVVYRTEYGRRMPR